MDQVASQLGNLFVQSIPTVVFVIFLLAFLNRLFFKPLSETVDARARATSGALAEARQQAMRGEEILHEYEQAMQSARQEIYQHREDVRRKALSERDSKLQQARSRAEAMVKAAQADLDKETEISKIALRTSVESLANEVTVSFFAPRYTGSSREGLES